nr:hypothetical protein [Tanacetum cinerariifolium]
MDNPNITIEEYIKFEEEKARRRGKVFHLEAATYDLITDSENDNDKVNMPLLSSPEPTVSYFDDLDYFNDFESEFPAIVYNDALTSKSDFSTELTLCPQHIEEFNLKDETSLSEYDEKEQNVLYINDLFSFNLIYPDDLKLNTYNDDDKVDIEHSSGDIYVIPLSNVINVDVGAYAHEDKVICDLNKTPHLFQEPPQNCPKCENPVDGQYCQGCAILRKKFKEDLFTYCIENGIFQDFQDTSKPFNDNTNVVNALQEPFVVKQDPDENSSQSAHYGDNCPPKVSIIPDPEPCHNQNVDELPQTLPSFDPTCYSEAGNSFTYDSKLNIVDDSPNNDDDDEDCTIAIAPILSIKEPDNSLSMGDEHLDTILATESDELIKSSIKNLVPIPNQFENFFDSNVDSTSIDDDSFSIDNIEYVEASPPDSELVSLEVLEIVIPEVGGIDVDILLTIKDDILCEKLLNINLLIANIEALKDNPTSSSDFMTNGGTTTRFDISLPDYEAFYDDHVKEISSGSTTTHFDFTLYDSFIFDFSINPFPHADRSDFYHEEFADERAHIISPPEYDCFCFKNEPNSGDFTMVVAEDTFPTREPRVHVHNVLPTHPTLQMNFDFILFSESLFAYVVWIFLPFLSYSVAPQYLLSFRNEDTILIPAYPIIKSLLLCWMYLIEVELS